MSQWYLDAALTTEQVVQLYWPWQQYEQRMMRVRRERASAVAQAQCAAARQLASWQAPHGTSAEKASAYCDMADHSGCLGTWVQEELLAVVDLQDAMLKVRQGGRGRVRAPGRRARSSSSWRFNGVDGMPPNAPLRTRPAALPQHLTPVQAARVHVSAFPYAVDPVQLIPWLVAGKGQTAAELAALQTAVCPSVPEEDGDGAASLAQPAAAGDGTDLLDMLLQDMGGEFGGMPLDGFPALNQDYGGGGGGGDAGHLVAGSHAHW